MSASAAPPAAGAALRADPVLGPLSPALVPWLLSRRWFPHNDGRGHDLVPIECSVLRADDAVALVHTLLEDRRPDGGPRCWQLLIGLRLVLPTALATTAFGRATGGRWHGWWLYDATADPQLMSALVRRTLRPRSGEPRLALTGAADRSALGDLVPRALIADQSNTSVVFGDRLMFKLIRSPQQGVHPEAEVLSALTRLRCPSTPRLAGRLQRADNRPAPTVLGILTEFLANDGDAYQLALAEAAARRTGEFTGYARSLGTAVAELHGWLAQAFGTGALTRRRILAHTSAMGERLAAAVAEVPELEPYADRLAALHQQYARLADSGRALVQRIHGDLHLGQILRTPQGWRFIDFEGEPAGRLVERRSPEHPLRDVAGMFRSFDYAAQQALAPARPDQASYPAAGSGATAAALAWSARNRRAFAQGYTAAGGLDPDLHSVAVRALEADKAVYEAVYEARHRPAWLPIPLAAIDRTLSGSGHHYPRRPAHHDRNEVPAP